MKHIILIILLTLGAWAKEIKISSFVVRQKVSFENTNCKDVQQLLQVINIKSGWNQFCAEVNDFYKDIRMVDGSLKTVKIHRPTNLVMLGDSREDDYALVDVSVFFYDLNNDGTKEVFFDHHSPYASAPFNLLERKNDTYEVIDTDGLIRNAKIYILAKQTNGYFDILAQSDYWHELWLYQHDGKLYKLVKRIKFN